MDGEGFYEYGGRPTLNTVIVLDVSGSMGDSFHHDNESKPKLEVAKEVLFSLLDRFKPEDRFGLVLFNTEATVLQKLQELGKTNIGELKEKISRIHQGGGTTLNVGLSAATKFYEDIPQNSSHENRILFLTDMQPSGYDSDSKAMMEIAHHNAYNKKIYSTFIGVGIDFDTQLVATISKIRATNYFAVKSAKDFKRQMNEEFDYIVTPNVFDCEISLSGPSSQDWTVVRVFGSPGYEYPKNGRMMYMDSSFPSVKTGETETKGGVIVVQLKKINSSDAPISLLTKYKDRLGKEFAEEQDFKFPNAEEECYENLSVRKAVLLTRYVSFMKHFLRDAAKQSAEPSLGASTGIIPPTVLDKDDKQANGMVPLKPLNESFQKLFKIFLQYYEKEMEIIKDKQLEKEHDQLSGIFDKSVVKKL